MDSIEHLPYLSYSTNSSMFRNQHTSIYLQVYIQESSEDTKHIQILYFDIVLKIRCLFYFSTKKYCIKAPQNQLVNIHK